MRRVAAALSLFVLSLLALALVRDRSREDVLGSDEPEWIAISVLHVRQLVEGGPPPGAELEDPRDFPDPDDARGKRPWTAGVQRTTFGYMNPCFAKLVWGVTLRAAGYGDVSPLVFQSFQEGREAEGERARAALLPAMPLARRVVLVFAAATLTLLSLAARAWAPERPAWAGTVAAACAWLLWLATPLVHRTATYLRTDWFMLAFLVGAWLLVLHRRVALFGRGPLPRRLGLAVLLGVLLGLALSSKLNGSLAAIGVTAVAVAGVFGGREDERSHPIGALAALAVAGVVAAALFVALHPVTWGAPLEGAREVLARWERHTGFIQDTWAPRTGVEVVRTPGERLGLFARAVFGRHEPFAAWTGLPIGAVLAALGALVAWRAGPAGRAPLAFAVVLLLGTVLALPVDWERLYLPALLAAVLLEVRALAWGAERLAGGRGGAEGSANTE